MRKTPLDERYLTLRDRRLRQVKKSKKPATKQRLMERAHAAELLWLSLQCP